MFKYLDRKFFQLGVSPGRQISRPLRMPLIYTRHVIKEDYLKTFKYEDSQPRPVGSVFRNLLCRVWCALGVLLGRYDLLHKG